jgi:hypothetical protein
MATLTGNTIASTYTGLLSVTGAVGADTVEAVTDGAGTSTSLSLSQQRATITLGSGAADDFIVDGTTLVVEGDNNRVGIGTASPSTTLDVNGAVNMASTLTIGGDLTIPQKIVHSGDTDTFLSFGDDSLSLFTGNASASVIDFIYGNIYLKGNNKALIGYTTGASAKELIKIDSSDVVQIGEGLDATFAGDVFVSTGDARLGVGVTSIPHWGSGFDVLSVGHSSQYACETADGADRNVFWTNNLYYDGTGTYGYARHYTDEASMIQQRAGTIRFFTDASGTADADFNPSERMRITSGGNVGVGITSPAYTFQVVDGDNNGSVAFMQDNYDNTVNGTMDIVLGFKKNDGNFRNAAIIRAAKDDVYTSNTEADGRLEFHTTLNGSSTERMRIASDGTFTFKNTSARFNFYADSTTDIVQYFGGHDTDGDIRIAGSVSVATTAGTNACDGQLIFATATGNTNTERMRIDSSGNTMIGRTSNSFNNDGCLINSSSFIYVERSAGTSNSVLYLHRRNGDGNLIDFYESNSLEGSVSVSGNTVSYNGFSGTHDSSGIASDTAIGTVLSTIDEEHKADHAKVKVSDSVGDKRVYGVLQQYVEETTNDDTEQTIPEHAVVASVGIGSVKVTGACQGGDLLESNGDGTAKVQDDDIIRSKTIGKVTIGDSDTSVKLVSCVLYCG